MAEVYWIHLPEHTDMFSEGYIGKTNKNARVRYQGHISVSKKGITSSVISNVLRKYGHENLVVETLVICTPEYAIWLENKLRPEKGIGWNMAVGGGDINAPRTISDETREKMRKSQTGKLHTQESKDKISATLSKVMLGHKHSDETRAKISESNKGKKSTKEAIEKGMISKFYFYVKNNREVYSRAVEFYDSYLSGVSSYLTEKSVGMPRGSLVAMFQHFKTGWNPLNDDVWVSEYAPTNKEASVGSLTT